MAARALLREKHGAPHRYFAHTLALLLLLRTVAHPRETMIPDHLIGNYLRATSRTLREQARDYRREGSWWDHQDAVYCEQAAAFFDAETVDMTA